MENTCVLAACMTLLTLGTFPALADNDDDAASCTLAIMRGTYAWDYAATNVGGPYSTTSRKPYDGHGHMQWYQLFNSAGTASYTYSGIGTYTMTIDCVASVVYNGFHNDAPYTYFVAPHGDSYYWNNNFADGTVAGTRVDRISKALLVH